MQIASPQLYSWWGGQQDFLSACIVGFFQNLSAFLGYFCSCNLYAWYVVAKALVLNKLKVISLWQSHEFKFPRQLEQILFVHVDSKTPHTQFSVPDARLFNFPCHHRGGSRGEGAGGVPPPPEMTCGFLIELVFCKKKLPYLFDYKPSDFYTN